MARGPLATRVDPPWARQLVLVTGKGGVGKTTVAQGLARLAAGAGRRPLVVSLAGDASAEPTLAGEGVHRVRIDVGARLESYVARHVLGGRFEGLVRRGSRSLLRSANGGVLGRLLGAAPGVPEVLTVEAIGDWVEGGEFDPVIVDMESTGHALMLLDTPEVLGPFTGDTEIGALLRGFADRVRDPAVCGTVVVCTPESVVLEETRELLDGLVQRGLEVAGVVVNRMPPPVPPVPDRGTEMAAPDPDSDRAHDLAFAEQCRQLRVRALANVDALELAHPVCVDEVLTGSSGPDLVATVVQRLAQEWSP